MYESIIFRMYCRYQKSVFFPCVVVQSDNSCWNIYCSSRTGLVFWCLGSNLVIPRYDAQEWWANDTYYVAFAETGPVAPVAPFGSVPVSLTGWDMCSLLPCGLGIEKRPVISAAVWFVCLFCLVWRCWRHRWSSEAWWDTVGHTHMWSWDLFTWHQIYCHTLCL